MKTNSKPVVDHTVSTEERVRNLSHIVQLLAFGAYDPFCGTDGGAWLAFRTGLNGRTAVPARSPRVRALLTDEFCKIHGRPPAIDKLRMALRTIEGKALQGPVMNPALRLSAKPN